MFFPLGFILSEKFSVRIPVRFSVSIPIGENITNYIISHIAFPRCSIGGQPEAIFDCKYFIILLWPMGINNNIITYF